MNIKYHRDNYKYLIEDLELDVSDHWSRWDWKKVSPWNSYDFARLEEYRDSVLMAYRLYNLVGLAHIMRILKDMPNDVNILDAGGGTGRKAIPLAQAGFSRITLMDISVGWLRLAREKAEKAGVMNNIKFVLGNVLDMNEFQDNRFHLVLGMGGVVSYCGDPATALKEMTRVLKPGGKIFCDGIHNRLGGMHFLAQLGFLKELKELAYNTGDSDRYRNLSPEELKEIALSSGLEDVEIGSEFMFCPNDSLVINDDTPQWEEVVVDLELKHYRDPRFLGTCNLLLEGVKGNQENIGREY